MSMSGSVSALSSLFLEEEPDVDDTEFDLVEQNNSESLLRTPFI
jgi:hypothetical protein